MIKTPLQTSAQVVSCFVRLLVEPVLCEAPFCFFFLRMKLKMEVSQVLNSDIFATLNTHTHAHAHVYVLLCMRILYINE